MKKSTKFKPTLKLPHVVALYIGAVLGSGILILPGLVAEVSGPASLLAWGLMAVVVVPMALTIGLLSAKHPNVGGVSHFVSKAFNANIGSLIGWFFLMSVVVGAPVLALTGAGYLSTALGLNDTYRLVIAVIILSVGLLTNYYGMKVTGQLQVAVVLTTLAVLVATIAGSLSNIDPTNFAPFMPYGWLSVGQAATILFWCFIGWEAVSHISEEFENPKKEAILGAIIAAVIISAIYFMTAFVVVGTHSYGPNISDVSLIYIIKTYFGQYGAIIAGFAALFICIAPAIAYIGATSRLAYSLSVTGYAPKHLSILSKYNTPLGGLYFLAVCFTILLIIFSSRLVSLSILIQIPNATFILTYLGGCAAGIILLKDNKFGVIISVISLVLTGIIFLFLNWTLLYPLIITLIWLLFMLKSKKLKFKNIFQKMSR
jgi:Gamma-aminobutyrate permease and related permeases